MNLPDVYEDRSRSQQLTTEDPSFFRQTDDEITFSYLWAMLRRRLPVLILTAALCFLIGLLFVIASPRVYDARADLVLITNQADMVPSDTTSDDGRRIRSEDVETQMQLISSREMAEQVFDEIDLASDNFFRADVLKPRSTLDNIRSAIGLDRDIAISTEEVDAQTFRDRALAYIMSNLEVERVGNSYSLRIAVSDSVPDRAAQIANAYARLFTTDDARQRAQRNATAAQVLGERLEELREQANDDFAAVQGYRVRNNLLSASATGLSEQEVSTLNQQIASARAEAAEAAQALATARVQLAGGGAGNVGRGTASPVIASLRSQRAQLTTREADLARRYLDGHPELITVREQIASIDNQINGEIGREVRALESAAQATQQRLNSLLSSRGGTRSTLRGDNIAMVQLADLQRQSDASQAQYQSYLQRYNEVLAGSGTEQPGARMISFASAPAFPSSPNWTMMLGLSIVVGLGLGALLAILSEIAYRGLTTLDDVENRLGLNALGFIPDFKSVKPAGSNAIATVSEHPDGPFAESLRNVLVSIGRVTSGRCEVIAITSSIPGEGKTTLSTCLAKAIAMANQSVIVVDCDIIRSQLSQQFKLNNGDVGLHEALQDGGEIAQYEDSETGMHILPITKPFRKGERLTENGRLHRVVAQLRDRYDFVVLDCPPILPIAESREIVAIADHVVLAVAWRKTLDKIVHSAIRQLPMRVLAKTGVALNLVDMRKQVRFGGNDAASFYKHYEAYYG